MLILTLIRSMLPKEEMSPNFRLVAWEESLKIPAQRESLEECVFFKGENISVWLDLVLSLHVWRKTLRGGMPALLFTIINAVIAKERA